MAPTTPKPTDAATDDAPALDLPDYLDPAIVTEPGEEPTADESAAEWIEDGSATRAAALMAAAAFRASANISLADLIETARELEPYLNGTDATPVIEAPVATKTKKAAK